MAISQINTNSIAASAVTPGLLDPTSQYMGFKNRIINGAMAISQRGTTINGINADNTYTADRWSIQRGGTINYSQGTSNPPSGFQYYASFINQTASNPFLVINQNIETVNCYDLAGQTVTLSAWIKAAANTAASTSIALNYGYATTADTKYTTIGTATNFTISSSSWTKCSITFTVASNALTISPVFNSTTSLAVGDGYLITGVQLEKGTTATSFDYRPYGTELALCQRYFLSSYPDGVAINGNAGLLSGANFTAVSTGDCAGSNTFPVRMRASPSITIYAPGGGSGVGTVRNASSGAIVSSVTTTNDANQFAFNRISSASFTSGIVYSCQYLASAEL